MGLIDVSDLFSDPDFVKPITHIKRTSLVNNYGQNEVKEQGFPTFGCVQPATGKTLQRLPEALRVVDVMSFWLKGKISSDGCGKYPDVLVSSGQRYQVQVVFDWTDWGNGWCEGTCVREKPSV